MENNELSAHHCHRGTVEGCYTGTGVSRGQRPRLIVEMKSCQKSEIRNIHPALYKSVVCPHPRAVLLFLAWKRHVEMENIQRWMTNVVQSMGWLAIMQALIELVL